LKLLPIALVMLLSTTACTDAKFSKLTTLGSSAHVQCYSGGKLIADYHSTGKIANEEQSDGYYFVAKEDGKAHTVSGDCDISY